MIKRIDQLFFPLNALVGKSLMGDYTTFFLAEVLIVLLSFLSFLLVARIAGYKGLVKLVLSLLLTLFIAFAIGFIFPRERPFAHYEIKNLALPVDAFSFPSKHAAISAVLAYEVYRIKRRLGYFFILLAFLIGIARIISGVHFPTDVIFGLGLGFAVSAIVHYLAKG